LKRAVEMWKSIIDFPNYEVNILGEVRNVIAGRILKGLIDSHGYLYVVLCNGKQKKHYVHRLLGLYFIPNPDNKPCIDHINRIRSDNRIENLRWATRAENSQNVSLHKNNKLQQQYICKDGEYYRFYKTFNGICHSKHFKTLEEAINYRDLFISNIQTDQL